MAPKIRYLLPARERVMGGRPEGVALLGLAQRAEGLGYDSVWIGDSLFDKPRHERLIMLAGIAGRTSRVGWGPPYLPNRKLPGRLHRIARPTALLWGEYDRLIPIANGRAYAEKIPQSSMQVMGRLGHSPILEQPDEGVARIADFLATGTLPANDGVSLTSVNQGLELIDAVA